MLVLGDLAIADDGDRGSVSWPLVPRHRHGPYRGFRRRIGRSCRARRQGQSRVAPASSHGRILLGLIPPTAMTGRSLGSTASCAFNTAGVAAFGRKQLQCRCTGADRREGFRGGEIARTGDEAGRSRSRDHFDIGVGRDDDPSASVTDALHIGLFEHGSRSDQHAIAELRGQPFDTDQRVGRVQRNLDDPDAAFVDRLADRLGFVGRYAADDRRPVGTRPCSGAAVPLGSRQILFAIS